MKFQEQRNLRHWTGRELAGAVPVGELPARSLPPAGGPLALPSRLAHSEARVAVEESQEAESRAHSAGYSISSPLEANFEPPLRSVRDDLERRRHPRGFFLAPLQVH